VLPATTHEASSRQIATISEYTMPILADEQHLRVLIRAFFRSSAGWQLWRAAASPNSSPYFLVFSFLSWSGQDIKEAAMMTEDRDN